MKYIILILINTIFIFIFPNLVYSQSNNQFFEKKLLPEIEKIKTNSEIRIDWEKATSNTKEYIESLKTSESKIALEYLLNPTIDALNLKIKTGTAESINYNLLIFIYLMEKDAYEKGDLISTAISLTAGYLYEFGDEEVRKLVIEDSIQMFQYYQFITNFQKEKNLPYNLKDVTFFPKLYWSDRTRYSLIINIVKQDSGLLNKESYLHYVIRNENLKEYFNLAIDNDLFNKSLFKTTKNIDNWSYDNFRYHNVEIKENEVLPEDEKRIINSGENWIWDGKSKKQYFNINGGPFQLSWYKKNKFFSGYCGTQTTIASTILQSLGIPSYTTYFLNVTIPDHSHTFSMYYHPIFKKWTANQIPKNEDKPGLSAKFHFFKALPNQSFISNSNSWYEEIISFSQLEYLYTNGINEDLFQKLHFAIQNSKILKNSKVLNKPSDRDYDGISDEEEKVLKTNPDKWDTDGDLLSDLYELENGTSPTIADDISGWEPSLEGYVDDLFNKNGVIVISDKIGDSKVSKNKFDISQFAGVVMNDNLYLGVKFSNNIRTEKSIQHELWFESDTGAKWINCWPGGEGYKMMKPMDDGKWVDVPTNKEVKFMIGNGVKYKIPLSILGYPKELKIKYTVFSGPEGKEVRGSDESESLILKIGN